MKRRLTFLLLLAASLGAAEITFNTLGLTIPVFDSAGHRVRQLSAEKVTGAVDALQLEQGKVEFFAPESADQSVSVLDFAEAFYRKSDETIRGPGIIALAGDAGIVSGRGYECWLETGILKLDADVQIKSADFRLAGRQGEIRIDRQGRGKARLIAGAEVTGEVTIEPTPRAKLPFDRALTQLARYDGERQKLFLKTPVMIWKNGERGEMNLKTGFAEFDIGANAIPGSAKSP